MPTDPKAAKPLTDPPAVLYSENLRAPWWAWLVLLFLTLLISLAFAVPLGPIWGAIILAIFAASSIWFLTSTAVHIVVTGTELRVGRAHLGWEYTGIVATLDAEAASRARGVEADPRAFAVNRPLTAKEAITVEVIDDDDPHPYWLISTKRPLDLGRAIRKAQLALEGNTPANR